MVKYCIKVQLQSTNLSKVAPTNYLVQFKHPCCSRERPAPCSLNSTDNVKDEKGVRYNLKLHCPRNCGKTNSVGYVRLYPGRSLIQDRYSATKLVTLFEIECKDLEPARYFPCHVWLGQRRGADQSVSVQLTQDPFGDDVGDDDVRLRLLRQRVV